MFPFDRQRHRRARIAAVLATAALAVVGCSQTPPQASAPATGGGQAANSKIFMAPKFTGLAYFEVAKEGGEKAAQDLGIDFQYIGSDKARRHGPDRHAHNAIPQRPAALVVSAIDGDAVAPALRQARQKGIKVVTYDADAAVDSRDLFVNHSAMNWPPRRCWTPR
jgi:rhamnose transport system substrate-binding protein